MDDELAVYGEYLRFHALAIAVGTQMLECELSLEGDKKDLHLRAVNSTHQVLIDSLGTLQSTAIALSSPHGFLPSGKKEGGSRSSSGSNTPTSKIEPGLLCDTATQLSLYVLQQTDKEFMQKHAGFVPMSPLVEVMTRNSLVQTSTVNSVLSLSR